MHEIGHTLRSKHESSEGVRRLTDRYHLDSQGRWHGEVRRWGLMGTGEWEGDPPGSAPTHMSSFTKEAANWLRYEWVETDGDYALTSLENQRIGGAVLALDDGQRRQTGCYYILEARDGDVPYGAPSSGVLVYSVCQDRGANQTTVDALVTYREVRADDGREWIESPTLYGAGEPDGVTEFVSENGGLRVRLLEESFSPYEAKVRVGLLAPFSRQWENQRTRTPSS